MSRGEDLGGRRFVTEECCNCHVEFALPRSVYDVARQAREEFTFYCPYGHPQSYITGEKEVDKMRRERDQAVQRVAEWQDYAKHEAEMRKSAERAAAAARGQVTKIKKRASAGVCPCCNRHFTQLERHMHTKHPDFEKEPTS